MVAAGQARRGQKSAAGQGPAPLLPEGEARRLGNGSPRAHEARTPPDTNGHARSPGQWNSFRNIGH